MPGDVVELTSLTVAGVVSITNALLSPSEPVAPGVGNVSVLAFPAGSNIEPPLSANALVEA